MNRKIKCYSVRLSSLKELTDKSYLAKGFDGTSAVIPKSMLFGKDEEVIKSPAYWIAAFILEKRSLTYTSKKVKWFNQKK